MEVMHYSLVCRGAENMINIISNICVRYKMQRIGHLTFRVNSWMRNMGILNYNQMIISHELTPINVIIYKRIKKFYCA